MDGTLPYPTATMVISRGNTAQQQEHTNTLLHNGVQGNSTPEYFVLENSGQNNQRQSSYDAVYQNIGDVNSN